MKANAPEKIYLYPSDRAGEEFENEWGDKPWGKDYVEYTRTDVFVEKAIKYIANHFLAPGMDNEIKDFINYMKGE